MAYITFGTGGFCFGNKKAEKHNSKDRFFENDLLPLPNEKVIAMKSLPLPKDPLRSPAPTPHKSKNQK